MSKITTSTLLKMKQQGEKITTITAYDASFAKLFDSKGVDVILIGDSLGMVLKGEPDTLAVTVAEIAYHTRAVSKGVERAFVIADMPFMSYGTPTDALHNAAQLMSAGASMVKVEGGEWLANTITQLTQRGVPVCAHLGLTPQSVNKLGGYRVQGRDEEKAQAMIDHSKALAAAGADCILLGCVPSSLGKAITEAVDVPVIGIGAGSDTDAQVLVVYDMLGLGTGHTPKFVKNFMTDGRTPQQAIAAYGEEVKAGKFPSTEYAFS